MSALRFFHQILSRYTPRHSCYNLAHTHVLRAPHGRGLVSTGGLHGSSASLIRASLLPRPGPDRDTVLRTFPVGDLWGVGRRLAPRLESMGISTAAALRDAPADDILTTFGVTLARTQRELQGHPCMELEEVEPDRQQIMVSRSFADRVEDHDAVAQALATFAIRACEKLRARGLVTAGVWVFAHSDTFRPELRQHNATRSVSLPAATADTMVVLGVVRRLLRGLLREGSATRRQAWRFWTWPVPKNCRPTSSDRQWSATRG